VAYGIRSSLQTEYRAKRSVPLRNVEVCCLINWCKSTHGR